MWKRMHVFNKLFKEKSLPYEELLLLIFTKRLELALNYLFIERVCDLFKQKSNF